MFLSPLTPPRATLQTSAGFGGYDSRETCKETDLYRAENLSARHFPLLSPRLDRDLITANEQLTGIFAKDALCYTAGSALIINGYPIELGLTDSPKALVSMGAYLLILPDKKYINTADLSDFGSVEATVILPSQVRVTYTPTDRTGAPLSPIASALPPENPQNGSDWLDTSQSPPVLRRWSESTAFWTELTTGYIKIAAPAIGTGFSAGDGVSLEGLPPTLAAYAHALLIEVHPDWLLIEGLAAGGEEGQGLTVKRTMPDADFLIEAGNRLWGCRYGIEDGRLVNQIFACRLGDFRNWQVFQGLSTDSYRVSVGSDGPFTGAFTYLGMPHFFKEDCIHKLYGALPEEFRLVTTPCQGIQKGSGQSPALVNSLLYYQSPTGICVYDGSLPTHISTPLGEKAYGNAIGGGIGSRYYVDMEDENHNRSLFCYDTRHKLWHREDSPRPLGFARSKNKLYCATAAGILCLDGSQSTCVWQGSTGLWGLHTSKPTYISRLLLRLSLAAGAEFRLYIEYDSDGERLLQAHLTPAGLTTYTLPVRLRRCDHFRLHFSGQGDFTLYSISVEQEQ